MTEKVSNKEVFERMLQEGIVTIPYLKVASGLRMYASRKGYLLRVSRLQTPEGFKTQVSLAHGPAIPKLGSGYDRS